VAKILAKNSIDNALDSPRFGGTQMNRQLDELSIIQHDIYEDCNVVDLLTEFAIVPLSSKFQ